MVLSTISVIGKLAVDEWVIWLITKLTDPLLPSSTVGVVTL